MLTKRQKIGHAAVFVLIIALVMGVVNYHVDSYAQIRVTYTDIADRMLSGYHVEGLTESRCNERYQALAVIEQMQEAPETIMLGSSRSMIYGAEELGEDSFYNFSLSGGSLLDYCGIVGYLENEGKMPGKIILEIGGPLLNEGGTDARYTYLQGGIDYLDGVISGEKVKCDYPAVGRQYHKLLSIGYFKYNVECLMEPFRFEVNFTREAENPNSTKLSDGSVVYGEGVRNTGVDYVRGLTDEVIASGSLYKIDDFVALSGDYVARFENLVELLMDRGVEVEFFIPPYSEPVYGYITEHQQRYRGVTDTEEYIVKYAGEKGIKVFGSYSPSGCGLILEDLYDPYHMRRENGMKAFYLRQF